MALNKKQTEHNNRQFIHDGLSYVGINPTEYIIDRSDIIDGAKDFLIVLSDGTKYLEKLRVENGQKVFYPSIIVTDVLDYTSYTYKG